jgi:hypothetical protein
MGAEEWQQQADRAGEVSRGLRVREELVVMSKKHTLQNYMAHL